MRGYSLSVLKQESSALSSRPNLPPECAYLGEYAWSRTTIGKSEAAVWRLEGNSEVLFLKAAPVHPFSELPGEAARLRWLESTTLIAPRLRDFRQGGGTYWLLMTALRGSDLTRWTGSTADPALVLAGALRTLHQLDPSSCPFDHRLEQRLAVGSANLMAGLVDEADFDTARAGWTGQAVLDWLGENRPQTEDLVVTHGDASLPNFIADADALSGMVDWGRLGVADRWQDLAIACRSLIFNAGQAEVSRFLHAYGASWDEERYRYYCTLDELF